MKSWIRPPPYALRANIVTALALWLVSPGMWAAGAETREAPEVERPPEPEEQVHELPKMTVTASPLGDTGYSVPNATSGTKISR